MTTQLRPWRQEDAAALLDACTASDDLGTQLSNAAPSSVRQAQELIESSLSFTDSVHNWAIVSDGEVCGNVGLSNMEFRHQSAWAYYWLSAPFRGRGFATIALTAAADWAFTNGLFRLELGHRVNNPASCAVATGAGFAAEGVERAKLRYGSQRYDVETHARLATDPTPGYLSDARAVRVEV